MKRDEVERTRSVPYGTPSVRDQVANPNFRGWGVFKPHYSLPFGLLTYHSLQRNPSSSPLLLVCVCLIFELIFVKKEKKRSGRRRTWAPWAHRSGIIPSFGIQKRYKASNFPLVSLDLGVFGSLDLLGPKEGPLSCNFVFGAWDCYPWSSSVPIAVKFRSLWLIWNHAWDLVGFMEVECYLWKFEPLWDL